MKIEVDILVDVMKMMDILAKMGTVYIVEVHLLFGKKEDGINQVSALLVVKVLKSMNVATLVNVLTKEVS